MSSSPPVPRPKTSARYQDLFDFAPDGYLVTGPRGRIEEVNQAATELLNVPALYLLSKPLAVFVHGSDRPLLAAALSRMKTANREEWTLKLTPRNLPARTAQVTAGGFAVGVENWRPSDGLSGTLPNRPTTGACRQS